jgi:nucleotide-binding universal stress UspA family protein
MAMKKIFVPTDFSPNAEHALRFVCELNKKLKATVVLHHSFLIPVYATEVPVLIPTDAELQQSSEEGLQQLKERFRAEYPDMRFETLVTAGYAEEEIADTAAKQHADLVVMGTRGASGIREALIGTITASVMEKAVCPVMAVPAEATWKNLDRIVFATGYAEGDFANAEWMISFARQLNAELVLLHVASDKNDKTYEFDAIERFKERLSEESRYPKLGFKLMEGRDVYEAVGSYLEEIRADMVAMTIHHRGPAEKLFQRSLTKRMAYHTHIPLIAFHEA